jgi:solute carrier family 13 (sodium-dependent dicarboxylate transporter), member 2/3/5
MLNFIIKALGPACFLILLWLDPIGGLTQASQSILGIAIWIALWWVTEVVPIPVTSLLPIILFPLTGVLDVRSTTNNYGNEIIFLYLGGFLIAIAVEKWNLHKRVALSILLQLGSKFSYIILGFMLATALLSMWISNTATSVMMLPIGLAISGQFDLDAVNKKNNRFGKVLMLGIAYGASIGGLATLIGTPPNLVLAAVVKEYYGIDINFMDWLILMFPLSMAMLFICWFYLIKTFKVKDLQLPLGNAEIKRQLTELGKISYEEKLVSLIFLLTAFGWVTKSFLLVYIFPGINDTIIAVVGGVLMFVVPGKNKQPLMTWKDAVKIPWDIILLFGGGLALAEGFKVSGLTLWIGSTFTILEGTALILLLLILIGVVNFLTEMTSNLATTSLILPILAAIAVSMDIHPYGLMVGATLSASCAFMLPVATPPNAVVFSSGYFTIKDMAKVGFILNIISILLITAFIYFIFPLVWDIDLFSFPVNFIK